jgi:hypothetical protein
MKGVVFEIPGEGYGKHSQMWIDSASLSEAVTAVFAFIFLSLITFLSSKSSLSPSAVQRTDRTFSNTTLQVFTFTATPVTGYNRFLTFDLVFVRRAAGTTPIPVSFAYMVETSSQTKQTTRIRKKVDDFIPNPSASSRDTSPIRLFDDRFLNYHSADLVVSVTVPDRGVYPQVACLVTTGQPDHTTYQAYFRLIYSIFEIGALMVLLKKSPIKAWAREQQIVLPLLILAPLSNNPFYLFHAYHPLSLWAVIDAVVSPLFHACVLLVLLLLFDRLLRVSASSGIRDWLSKILYVLPVFVSQAASGFHSITVSSMGPTVSTSRFEAGLRRFQAVGYLVFLVFLMSIIARILSTEDLTDSPRFHLYLVTFGFVSLVGLFEIINGWRQLFEGTMVNWVFSFTMHNLLTLMMIYYHWPYEFMHDQSHQIGSNDHLFANSFDDQNLLDTASDSDSSPQ